MRDRLAGRKSYSDRIAHDWSRDRGCRREMQPSVAVGKGFRFRPLSAIIVPAQRQTRRVGVGVRVNMRVDAIGFSGFGLGGIGVAPGRPLPFAMVALAAVIFLGRLPFALRRRLVIGFRVCFFGKGRFAAPSAKRSPTSKERTWGTRLSPSTTSLRQATRPPREWTAAARHVRGTSSATPARPRAT